MLIVLLFIWNISITSWYNWDSIKENLENDYRIIIEEDTEFWKIYYISNKYESRAIAPWDVVDIVMAWDSWATLFNEPSWANLWWAVLDTAALLPYVPSSWWVRKWGKYVLKDDALKNLAKTDKNKIKNAIKSKNAKEIKITASYSSKLEKDLAKKYDKKLLWELKNEIKKQVDKWIVRDNWANWIKYFWWKNTENAEIKFKSKKFGSIRIMANYNTSTWELKLLRWISK